MQSIGEEIVNSILHGMGFMLSVAGLSIMIVFSCLYASVWHIVGCTIFGSALTLLYLNSTLYHSLQHTKAKNVFRKLDHVSIYILIAGTYTPFLLTVLRGGYGWALFGVEWGLAVCGIVFKLVYGYRYDILATLGYAVMGWLIVIATAPLLERLPWQGVLWLLAGGLCYTGGIFFYFKDHKVKYFHAIWHLFVLAGSICHFFCVFFYLILA